MFVIGTHSCVGAAVTIGARVPTVAAAAQKIMYSTLDSSSFTILT